MIVGLAAAFFVVAGAAFALFVSLDSRPTVINRPRNRERRDRSVDP